MSAALTIQIEHLDEQGNISYTLVYDGAKEGEHVQVQPWMLAVTQTAIDGLKQSRGRIERELLRRLAADAFQTRREQLKAIRESAERQAKTEKEAAEIASAVKVQGES